MASLACMLVAVNFVLQTIAVDQLNFLVLHNNDMHGRFEETSRNSGTCKDKTPRTGRVGRNPNGCVGGFARTAHEIRRYRTLAAAGGSPVLYLNAGDTYVGTAWFSVHKWNISATFMNVLMPDAASLGNHEFDFGVSALAPFVDAVKFPIVAANLNFEKEPSLKTIKKSVILEVGGRKIGVVGHLITDTKMMSSPGAVIFDDVLESVRKETEILDQAGVQIIIILGHSGYKMDQQIAAQVPLADIVVGGHTNTFLWNGPQPDSEHPEDLYPKVIVQPGGKRVPVVQAYAYTKYLGVLNVTFDSAGDLVDFSGQPIFLDTSIPQDEDVLDLLETYRPAIDQIDKEVVGKSRVLLDATNNKCRLVECNQGNMVADALVYYMAAQYSGAGWTDTPIALVNGGGIRTTIDPLTHGGNITRGELMGSLPFENEVVTLKLTGAQLVQTLEIGTRSNGETSRGEFLQVSGLRVVYDLSKPSLSRVVSVAARCGNCTVPVYTPVVLSQTYQVVTVSFLSNGGDKHHVLGDAVDKQIQNLGDVDTVVWYLSKQSPVYPEEQGRIAFVQASNVPDTSRGTKQTFSILMCFVIIMIWAI